MFTNSSNEGKSHVILLYLSFNLIVEYDLFSPRRKHPGKQEALSVPWLHVAGTWLRPDPVNHYMCPGNNLARKISCQLGTMSCLLKSLPFLLLLLGEWKTWRTGSPGSAPTKQETGCPEVWHVGIITKLSEMGPLTEASGPRGSGSGSGSGRCLMSPEPPGLTPGGFQLILAIF